MDGWHFDCSLVKALLELTLRILKRRLSMSFDIWLHAVSLRWLRHLRLSEHIEQPLLRHTHDEVLQQSEETDALHAATGSSFCCSAITAKDQFERLEAGDVESERASRGKAPADSVQYSSRSPTKLPHADADRLSGFLDKAEMQALVKELEHIENKSSITATKEFFFKQNFHDIESDSNPEMLHDIDTINTWAELHNANDVTPSTSIDSNDEPPGNKQQHMSIMAESHPNSEILAIIDVMTQMQHSLMNRHAGQDSAPLLGGKEDADEAEYEDGDQLAEYEQGLTAMPCVVKENIRGASTGTTLSVFSQIGFLTETGGIESTSFLPQEDIERVISGSAIPQVDEESGEGRVGGAANVHAGKETTGTREPLLRELEHLFLKNVRSPAEESRYSELLHVIELEDIEELMERYSGSMRSQISAEKDTD